MCFTKRVLYEVCAYAKHARALGGATSGTGNLNMYASTIGLMPTVGVGIGTTVPSAPLHLYSATNNATNNIIRFGMPNSGIATPAAYRLAFGSDAFGPNDITGAISFIRKNAFANNAVAIAFSNYNGASSNSDLTSESMRIDSNGYVGISTTAPQASLHVNGNTLVSNPTVYNINSAAWYIIGYWDCSSAQLAGARLKVRVIGSNGYGAPSVSGIVSGGETTIYLTNLNGANSTYVNIDGVWKHEGGYPPFTSIKVVQNGSSRYQYYIYANVSSYTQHAISAETTQGTIWTTQFTSTTDPGGNTASVQLIPMSTATVGTNVGIGTAIPQATLHVVGNLRSQSVVYSLYGQATAANATNTTVSLMNINGNGTYLVSVSGVGGGFVNVSGVALVAFYYDGASSRFANINSISVINFIWSSITASTGVITFQQTSGYSGVICDFYALRIA